MTDGAQPHLLLLQGSKSNTILTLIEFSSMFFFITYTVQYSCYCFFRILQKALVAGWETPLLCIEWVEWS